jgi:hypothetical protein
VDTYRHDSGLPSAGLTNVIESAKNNKIILEGKETFRLMRMTPKKPVPRESDQWPDISLDDPCHLT